MEEALFKAVIEGNLDSLDQIMREDPLVLRKILSGCFKTNPLHLAISSSRTDFVKALLGLTEGELAKVLDSGRSALHLVAAKGDVEILQALLRASPQMCLARDPNGRNPIHIAAMEGRVDALKELVRACPNAARDKLDRDETVLHLCVKHGQLQTLLLLLNMDVGSEFVNARDSSGNTILHLAVYGKHFEIVKHIVNYDNLEVGIRPKWKKLEANVSNAEGHTPMDIALLSQNKQLKDFLRKAKCKQARDVVQQRDWLSERRDTLIVVVSLIATIAFQATLSPPGGFWQEDSKGHQAGEAVMAYKQPGLFWGFISGNAVVFLMSLTMIIALTSNLSFGMFTATAQILSTVFTVMCVAILFGFSVAMVTQVDVIGYLGNSIVSVVILWCIILLLSLGAYACCPRRDYQRKSMSSKKIFNYGLGDGNQEANDESPDETTMPYTATRQGNINQPQDEVQIEMKQRD